MGQGQKITQKKRKGKEKKVYQVIRQTGSGYQENRGTGNCHPQVALEAASRRNIC
jgi:hypothetical protein